MESSSTEPQSSSTTIVGQISAVQGAQKAVDGATEKLGCKAQLHKLSVWLREIELWLSQHRSIPTAKFNDASSNAEEVSQTFGVEDVQLLLGQYQNIQASIENYGTHLMDTREQFQQASSSSTRTLVHHVPAVWAVSAKEDAKAITAHHHEALINLIAPDNKSVRKEEEEIQSRISTAAGLSTPAAGRLLSCNIKVENKSQISARREKCLQRLERRWQQAWIACVERQYQLQDVIARKLNGRPNQTNNPLGITNFYNSGIDFDEIDALQPPSKCKRVHSPNNILCNTTPRTVRHPAGNFSTFLPTALNVNEQQKLSPPIRSLFWPRKSSSFHSLLDRNNNWFLAANELNKKSCTSKSVNCRMDNAFLEPQRAGADPQSAEQTTKVDQPVAAAAATRRHARRVTGSGRRSSDDGLDFGYSSDSSSSQLSSRDELRSTHVQANLAKENPECSTAAAEPEKNGAKRFLSTIARSLTSDNYHHVYSSSLRAPSVRYYSLPSAFSDSELFPNCRASTSFYYRNNNGAHMRRPFVGVDRKTTGKVEIGKIFNRNSADRRRICSSSSVIPTSWSNNQMMAAEKCYYQVTWQQDSATGSGRGRMKRWRDWCNKLAFSEEEWSENEQQRRKINVEAEPHQVEDNISEYVSSSATAFDTCLEELLPSDFDKSNFAAAPKTRSNNRQLSLDKLQQSHMQPFLPTPITTLKRKPRKRRKARSRNQQSSPLSGAKVDSIENKERAASSTDSSTSGSEEAVIYGRGVVKSRSFQSEFVDVDRDRNDDELNQEEETRESGSGIAPLGQRPSTFIGLRRRHASSLALMSPSECGGGGKEAPIMRRTTRTRSNNATRPRSWCISNNQSSMNAKLLDCTAALPELDNAASQATLVNGPSDEENEGFTRTTANVMMTPVTPPNLVRTNANVRKPVNREHSNSSDTTDDNTLQAEDAQKTASPKSLRDSNGHCSDTSSEISDQFVSQFWDDYQAAPYTSDTTGQNSNAEDAEEEFSSGEEGARATQLRRLMNFGENYDEYMGSGAEGCYDSSASSVSRSGGRRKNETIEEPKTLKRRGERKQQVDAKNDENGRKMNVIQISREKLAVLQAFDVAVIDDKVRLEEAVGQCAEELMILDEFLLNFTVRDERVIVEELKRDWSEMRTNNEKRCDVLASMERARQILAHARATSSAVSARFGSGGTCKTPDASPGLWFGESETSVNAEPIFGFSETVVVFTDEDSSRSGRDEEEPVVFKSAPKVEIAEQDSFFDAAHTLLTDCSSAMRSLLAARQQVEASLEGLRNGRAMSSSGQENDRSAHENNMGIVKLLTILDARLTAQLDSLHRVADECSTLQTTVNRQAQALVLLEADLATIDAAMTDFNMGKSTQQMFADNNDDLTENLADIQRINANIEKLRGDMASLVCHWSPKSSVANPSATVVLKAQAGRELKRLLKEASKVQRRSKQLLERATEAPLLLRTASVDDDAVEPEAEFTVNSVKSVRNKPSWFRRALLYSLPFHALLTIGMLMYFAVDESSLLVPKCCTNSLYRSSSSFGGLFYPTMQYLYSGDVEMPPM